MQQYVLALLHFNLQYCAGGLEGLWPSDVAAGNDALEDQMIVESFEPVLDLLDAHPTWGLDLELQARMIEVLAERHPAVLAHLKTLADAGRVELVSFHYSDQLWTAYGWRDQQHSLELVRRVFEEHALPLSGVVFTQEGQFGPGMLRRMPDYGYDVAVLPRNLASYQWGHPADATLYDADGVTVVPSNGGTGPGGAYAVSWSFLDDGELLATGDMNCYLGPAFVFSQAAVDRYEDELEAAEAGGASIATIGAYVDAVRDLGTVPLPPIGDGTWQPDDTQNLFRWMGGAGLFPDTEHDGAVLTGGVRTGRTVAAAEAVAGPVAVDAAWRELLLGQVSDATGWNPYTTETQYALDHFAAAEALAAAAVAPACAAHPDATSVTVDLATGGVSWTPPVAPVEGEPGVGPDVGLVVEGRTTATWTQDPAHPDVWALTVAVAPGEGPPSVRFAWDAARLATTAALVDDELLVLDPVTFPTEPFGMPLPAGLVGLRDGVWLVEDTATVHLAGLFDREAGTVAFRDETLGPAASDAWTFFVVEGDAAAALAFADARNVNPTVTLACPEVDAPPTASSCGCDGVGGAPWIALGPLLAALRRRRGPSPR